jgi:hypothetical protein
MAASAAKPFNRRAAPRGIEHKIHGFTETQPVGLGYGTVNKRDSYPGDPYVDLATGPETARTTLLLPRLGPARRKAVAVDTQRGDFLRESVIAAGVTSL